MKKTLLIDPFSGASGDMLLSALIDLGAPIDAIREHVLSIPELAGVRIDTRAVQRGHFAARQLVVDLPHEHAHRNLSTITKIIDGALGLSSRARARATEAFTRLATAEAKVHGTTVDKVHFHEVGAVDAILDIVGFFVAAESLGVEEFHYTTLCVGGGTVTGAHGVMPVPAPATLELLEGHAIRFGPGTEELLTPTAAAIIATVFSPIGEERVVKVGRVGYGAGMRDGGDMPNILRASVVEVADGSPHVVVIRCTIDDMNPEFYGHLMAELFGHGALEVYFSAVMMKKNRPGTEVTVLGEPALRDPLCAVLFAHSTTLGVRVALEERVELERRGETVTTALGAAKVKICVLPGGGKRMSPEYESCRQLAVDAGRPLSEVFELVREAWTRLTL